MTRMRRLFVGTLAIGGIVGLAAPASAHLHPLVPVECAPARTGAGNESEGLRRAPWAPDAGRFIVQLANPGRAEVSSGVVGDFAASGQLPNGVTTAQANCAQPQE